MFTLDSHCPFSLHRCIASLMKDELLFVSVEFKDVLAE